MKIRSRWLSAGATAVALGAVVTGTALAQPESTPADGPTVQDSSEDEVEEQDPALNGSIPFADDESESEADEADRLSELDELIGEDAAIDAATAEGGIADGASLENENGTVVYEVEVTRKDGTVEEVTVDAGNHKVLAREDEDDEADDSEDDESEDDEDDEVEHENEGEEDDHADESTDV